MNTAALLEWFGHFLYRYGVFIIHVQVLGAYVSKIEQLASAVKPHDPSFTKEMVLVFDHPPVRQEGACPPYFIAMDHERKEVAMYIRGLHLGHRRDYGTLMSDKKGEQVCDGRIVHFGMHRAAKWAMTHALPIIQAALKIHSDYQVTIVGHSLGAGVASIFTLLLALNLGLLNIERSKLRCYALAPPRVMSASLTKEYSDVIFSVIYQDDFLPRMSASAAGEVLGTAVACTGVFLCYHFVSQCCCTDLKNEGSQADSEELCPPGKVFHVVYKKPGSCKEQPLIVRKGLLENGNFERLVVSFSATSNDHSVLALAQHLQGYHPSSLSLAKVTQPPLAQEMTSMP